jgi:hypothetical protein
MAMLVAVVVAGCSSGQKADTKATESTTPSANGPSLDGLYKLEFDATKRTALGQPSPAKEAFSSRWAIRSHCGDNGCVATATRVNKDGSANKTRANLDFLDGKWVMVLGEDSKCNKGGQAARVLGTWVLTPQPDNTLTGTWAEITTGNDCPWVIQTPLKATRQGDRPDNVEVEDPASLPARKPSKADGFQGSYTQTVTHTAAPNDPGIVNIGAATFCVRNTDECATTQTVRRDGAVTQVTPLTFAGDRWTFTFDRPERTCPDGSPLRSTLHDEVMLPDPAVNPIDHLTGTRRVTIMEPCAGEDTFELAYQRNSEPPAAAAPAPAEPAPAPGEPAPQPAPAPGG